MNDIDLHCRTCDKRLPHRWSVGGCACLECNTIFDPHRHLRVKTPEPGPPTRSYDGGIVPQNWRDFVEVYDAAIEREIDNVVVALASCTCETPGEMECSNCEALEEALEEVAVNAMMIARRNSFYTQWERQRDAMRQVMERLQTIGYVGPKTSTS